MAKLDRILDRYDLKTLEQAVARRRARDKQLAKTTARRRELEKELSKLTTLIGGGSTAKGRRRGGGRPIQRKPNARRLNKITLAEALERVLKERKKPIHYKDLTESVLTRKLYRTKSKNLLTTVMITLGRDKRFKKVKPGVFALR